MSDDKPKHIVGVSVLLTDGCRRILLGERINQSAAGLLSTPGGRIEADQDMFATAIREFKEECGAEIRRPDLCFIGAREHFRYGNHYFMFYIHASKYYGTIQNCEPHKCKGWGWHDILDIPQERTTEPRDILGKLLLPTNRKGKLVRDKIPFIVPELRQTHTFRAAANKFEAVEMLIDKLKEEVLEFERNPSLEELVDIQEVLYAIKHHFNYDPVEFGKLLGSKSKEKGGFSNFTIMEPAS